MNVIALVFKRPLLYIGVSYIVFGLFVLDYFSTYHEIFPTLVRMTNSSIFQVLLVNTFIATFFLAWTIVRAIFFGSLNGSEYEALQGAIALYFVECVLSPLYLGESVMSSFTVFLVGLLLLRTFHKLADERVTTLAITDDARRRRWNAIRLAAFLVCVVALDLHITRTVWAETVRLRQVIAEQPSSDTVMEKAGLVMAYSGAILVGQCVLSAARCIVRLHRTLTHYGEDGHSAIAFYATNVTNLVESVTIVGMIIAVWTIAGPPFFLFRLGVAHILRCDETLRNLGRYTLLSRGVHALADVEAADLERETRCTICYDEMEAGPVCKRLPCGHCYHDHCLRGWFESNSTCPYCRATVSTYTQMPFRRAPNPPPPAANANADAAPQAHPGAAEAAGAMPEPAASATTRAHLKPVEERATDDLEDAEVVAAYAAYLTSLRAAGPRFAETAQNRVASEKEPRPAAQETGESRAVRRGDSASAGAVPASSPTSDADARPAPRPSTHPLLAKLVTQRRSATETSPVSLPAEHTSPLPPAPTTTLANIPATRVSELPTKAATTSARTNEERQAARLEAYRLYEQQVAEAQRTLQRALASLDAENSHASGC